MIEQFNPSSFALNNGHFIGLPFEEAQANIILLPVPWEATVSYAAGTALGPENILSASYQLDLEDFDFPNAWTSGIYMRPVNTSILELSNTIREVAKEHINRLEEGKEIDTKLLNQVNQASKQVNQWVYEQCKSILQQGKRIGLIGGEHSSPLGYLQALAECEGEFGILQIDAHCDLRRAYEEFQYSHASIFYNVLEEIPQVQKLIQVGIRDTCEEELNYAKSSNNRVELYTDPHIRQSIFRGLQNFHQICLEIVEKLPSKVYISFDIDGLDPKLCPNTGTPVPGGLEMQEAFYLLKCILDSGRQIIGFDLCEVGSATEWDGNVGARVAYKLSTCLAKSNHLI